MSHNSSDRYELDDTPLHPRASYGMSWYGVLYLMDAWAQRDDDAFLSLLVEDLRVLVHRHYSNSEGCPVCDGDIQDCATWKEAQCLMLAWLMGKVAF